jgi:hypothetical protein
MSHIVRMYRLLLERLQGKPVRLVDCTDWLDWIWGFNTDEANDSVKS